MAEVCEFSKASPIPLGGLARATAFLELFNPRIAALVLVATAVGFYLAVPAGAGMGFALVHTLLGTALVAAGANAFNQFLESEFDARMPRTAGRPLPSGRLNAGEVLWFAVAVSTAGVGYLALFANPLAAAVAAFTLLSYAFVYTPLKRRTSMCVFVGAIPGALPPVIGWAGATGTLAYETWLLFAIVFFWQLPHFMAIAWLYREDYRLGGYPMIPVIDADGTRTDLHMITHSVGLLAASVLPTLSGVAGVVYATGALVLGTAFLACGVLFVIRKTTEVARFHLVASITYLPLLCALLMIDKVHAA